MSDYTFEREARTPFSETFGIEDEGDVVGRVDLHYTASGLVHGTLCVPVDFDEDELQDLIAEIDERLVMSAEPHRDDFVVTVWRGASAGVYSEEDEDEEEDDDEDHGNGRHPIAFKPEPRG
ncbi:MAG: hypothetical protein WEC75_13425 [Dehalococcoidia bacterium]